jgi:hypothetical protein
MYVGSSKTILSKPTNLLKEVQRTVSLLEVDILLKHFVVDEC